MLREWLVIRNWLLKKKLKGKPGKKRWLSRKNKMLKGRPGKKRWLSRKKKMLKGRPGKKRWLGKLKNMLKGRPGKKWLGRRLSLNNCGSSIINSLRN